MGYIYIHTNKTNGKKYIGQTIQNPEKRWDNGNGYKSSTHFYSAIKKYGWDNFEHEVRRCPDCLLDVMESNLIKYYDTTNPDKGYNCDSGGNRNKRHSEETKRKMSEARKGKYVGEKNSFYGRTHSEETKRKISESLKGENNPNYGKHCSEETKKKLSESQKGENSHMYGKSLSEETRQKISEATKGENHPMYGKHHSEESKRKMSEAKKGENHPLYGKHHSEETKRKMSMKKMMFLYTVESPSGEIVKTSSMKDFCRIHDLHKSDMLRRGKSKGWTLLSKETLKE